MLWVFVKKKAGPGNSCFRRFIDKGIVKLLVESLNRARTPRRGTRPTGDMLKHGHRACFGFSTLGSDALTVSGGRLGFLGEVRADLWPPATVMVQKAR
jgi:hypothetical protein